MWSTFGVLDRTFFCRKMENTQSMKKEMDGSVFVSRQSRQYSFINNMIKVLFPICTLSCRVNNYERETPENTKNNQSQNTLNPGMAEEYITQVSEEIEGKVTKKLRI